MSFQDFREVLICSYAAGCISDKAFVILYKEYESANLCFPYWEYGSFELDDLERSKCKAEFRVEKEDIPRIAAPLLVPNIFRCSQGTICPGEEGLCLLLRRLSYRCCYHDLIHRFGRPVPELCMTTNTVLDWMCDNHGHSLISWNQPFFPPAYLERYAQAITMKGSPLTNCFGFIYGTVRQISKPGENQRILYNGHNRVHSLKFQSVALPNGLIANLYHPFEGRHHDAGM